MVTFNDITTVEPIGPNYAIANAVYTVICGCLRGKVDDKALLVHQKIDQWEGFSQSCATTLFISPQSNAYSPQTDFTQI